MVIPMRPGSRGASSRPPLYSQLYHPRSRTDLIDLTSMEDESAPDESRGLIELSRDSVESSWISGYPSEIHVTSPRENPSCAPPGKAESLNPLRIDNNDYHSHEQNAQKTEYGWSAHDYPSVVNVTGIDDVSEMGFQSQNGDQMNFRESKSSKTPIAYSQSFHQSKVFTVGLDSTASDILSRMRAIRGRMEVESVIGAENDSASARNSLSVATGRAIIEGEEILHDHRDDLPLEVNIKARNDTREGIIQAGRPTQDTIERIDNVPGEVNVSLIASSPLRYAQANYEASDLEHGDGDKESQENDDSRDLHPSKSSQSSRSSQSMYLRALSRRLSEKWRRNGIVSKGFESLPLSLSEPFAASMSEQATCFRNVESTDRDGPEIIDLNDYEDSNSQFSMNVESAQTDVADRESGQGQVHADVPSAAKTDDQPLTTSEPEDVSSSEAVQRNRDLQAAEDSEVKPNDSCTEKESSENHSCDIGDAKSLEVDFYASETDTQASISNPRGRERLRVSRAARKRKITGRSFQSQRENSPLKTPDLAVPTLAMNTKRDTDKRIAEDLSENVEPSKVECVLDTRNEVNRKRVGDSPKSQDGTQSEEEFDFKALLLNIDVNESRDQDVASTHKIGLGTIESKSPEGKGKEELDNVNGDNDANVDKKNDNLLEIDKINDSFKERKWQPLSLNLNVSDYATTTSGSTAYEVEVEDLYVSSSNSEEGKDIRIASMGGVIQGHSSEEAEDIASVVYTNSSESDLEPEYDIYDQCVMPFIPKFLDTACAWLDGEEYGLRRQQSTSSLFYKLQKRNVGHRKNSKKSNRSGNKTNRNFKGARSLDLREVSRFARPRRSTDAHVEKSQGRDPSDSSKQIASSPHVEGSTHPQPEVVCEGHDQPELESGRKSTEMQSDTGPLRFTFSESKSSADASARLNATTTRTETETRKRDPSVEPQPLSPTAERSGYDDRCGGDKVGLPAELQSCQESPFRKKLQERMESIKSRDAIGDGEGTMDLSIDATPKASPDQFFSRSPLRVSQDPPSFSPKAPQPSGGSMRSPKQAQILKISPRSKHNESEKINPADISSVHSNYLPGISSSPIHDKRMATFRDGRLVVTDAIPRTHAAAQQLNGPFAETSQAFSQGINIERPFDESAQKMEAEADHSFVDKLRERNSKRFSSAAGGPETLQSIRARRRMIEQKQLASSSQNRRSYQEHENEPATHEQPGKSRKTIQGDSISPRASSQHKDKKSTARRHSNSRSPSKLNERNAKSDSKLFREKSNASEAESDAHIDVIDAELAASLSAMNEDERYAALELVEKLRRRASTLQRRHKVRNRRLKSISESSNNGHDHVASFQGWGGNGFSISAA